MEGGAELRLKKLDEYIENFLKIRTKDGEEIPFVLNAAQRKVYAAMKEQAQVGKPVRVIALKARQLGFSTLGAGLSFAFTAVQPNTDTMVLAHVAEATNNIFKMHKLFLDRLPAPIRPMIKSSNAQEILFENPTLEEEEKNKNPGLRSRIRCATAGGHGVGRSYTIRCLHASEMAWWPGNPKDTLIGAMQAVPSLPGTIVLIESTPNGYNEFKHQWDMAVAGESDFVPVFCAWFENEDYRKTVSPGTVWSEEETELKERFRLDDEQLAWRRWAIINNCGGDMRLFRQEYPATPEEAFLSSGDCYFDSELISKRLEELRTYRPTEKGRFVYDVVYSEAAQFIRLTNIRWATQEGGSILIHKTPEEGVPYVIGGDTAGEGSDYFTAIVMDNTTAEIVAELRQQGSEQEYTRQVYCLGQYYNDALLAVEVNFSTYPINTLQAMGYPSLFVRTNESSYTHEAKKAFGYRTDAVTRPMMLATCKQLAEEFPEKLCSAALLREMLCFAYNDNGRPEAVAGEHDDMVMAYAITVMARVQQAYRRPPDARATRRWTEDMWEDYRNADEKERELIRRLWGEPE